MPSTVPRKTHGEKNIKFPLVFKYLFYFCHYENNIRSLQNMWSHRGGKKSPRDKASILICFPLVFFLVSL